MDEEERKVPVTILTGFLGSGKTTFIQHILHGEHGRKVAVIQNEFGQAIGIEEAMVMGSDGSEDREWIDLPNGCVCCSVRDDFVMTVENLLKRRNDLDQVIIETTGVADPGPVASVFWLDDELESNVYLDAIITLADAKNITSYLDRQMGESEVNEAERQLAFADRIILNKTDLVPPAQLDIISSRIRAVNATCPILCSQYAKVTLAEVLDLKAYDTDRVVDPNLPAVLPDNLSYGHSQDVRTVVLTTDRLMEENTLTRWLGMWAWQLEDEDDLAKKHGMHVYRIKGLLALTENKEKKFWLQGVDTMFDMTETSEKWDDDRMSKIVFIGRNLQADVIKHSFASFVLGDPKS
mmetsp:Transcript_27420/g.76633  ORF Transcript_27420/g.76633 Transcript_27420/m.76633 type:complete len:351 (+) Transcript_27420:92-1144(+)|eukprot:CAMPEP_0119133758 /NCGR_PEP_ID=MMETSP1310-20130426/13539_1 /TAXON_ID=464262 /ORGANISM="Genus nov. species nov., Strain RCC2339" /LENGTH=350 /DNA_ID=CAMNT_0007124459 /DNA_START=38 /DNA_END=1093 /DNA_ORIENTATION=+